MAEFVRRAAGVYVLGLLAAASCMTRVGGATPARPLIIAHRGASGALPEHTLEAYALAIDQGADYIEPDVVCTKDGVLIARHENEIGSTTDVATTFPERRRTAVVDGDTVVGWFTEDFTLEEIKRLRARERLGTRSHANDGKFAIPTLDEVLALAERRSREVGRRIGVYPETKHPSYFSSLGLPLEERLLRVLKTHGFHNADDPVFIQSFEVSNLRALRTRTSIRLVQLLGESGSPYDALHQRSGLTYAAMTTQDGLRTIATYANAIGPAKALVQPIRADGSLGEATRLVADAHAAGLEVHVWTLRSDALPSAYAGDPGAEWQRFAALGVDGIFGDFPAAGWSRLRRATPHNRP